MTVSPAQEAILLRNAWFARQKSHLQRELLRAGRVASLAKGQWVCGQGDEETGVCAVLSGALRIEVALGGDQDVLLGLAAPPTILGQSKRHGGGPRIVTVRANVASKVLLIEDRALMAIASTHPGVIGAVNELVYVQLEESVRLAASQVALGPAGRIAMHLLRPEDDLVRINQDDLGEMTGLSRKTVAGHLKSFADAGAITVGYGSIRILDRKLLSSLAEGGRWSREMVVAAAKSAGSDPFLS